MRLRFLRPRLLLVLVSLAIAGLVGATTPRLDAADSGAPIEIHAVLALTGSAAFLGKAETAALTAFEDTINKAGGIRGRRVKIVIEDDQTSPQVAVQLMNAVLLTKPAIVVDGGPATTCRATSALIQSDGPVEYCFTPTVPTTPGGYVFSSSYSTEAILGVSLRYLKERGLTKVAILNATDATGQAGDQILADFAKNPTPDRAGIVYVDQEHYNLTDLSVAAQLTRIKAAGAQALIVFTTGTAIATVMHGIQDVGLDIPMFTSPGNMSYPQMIGYKTFIPKELLFAGSPLFVPDQVTDQGVKRAVLAYGDALKSQGLRPDLLNAVAWDPMNLVAGILQRLGPDTSASALRGALSQIKDYPGALGRYDFIATPQRGISSNWVVVERWDPDKAAFIAVSKPGGAPL